MQLVALSSVILIAIALASTIACGVAAVAFSFWRACPTWLVIVFTMPCAAFSVLLLVLFVFSDHVLPTFWLGVLAANVALVGFCGMQVWKRHREKSSNA